MNEAIPNNPRMQNTIESPSSSRAMFDHEKLDVYQLELQFIAWVTDLLEEVCKTAKGTTAEVRDQLDRASLSALLNTADGNGKRQRQVRAKFFDDPRGSATECAGCLDALVAKRVVARDRILEGKRILARVVSMLCGLIDRFDVAPQVREEATGMELPAKLIPVSYQEVHSRTRTTTRRK